jgi:cytochrome c oxidase accessory protein FixG
MNGHPTILLDIAARHFYIFGNIYNAQDAPLLVFILTGIGFLLIVTTALFGRLWCGWACPQTGFLEGVFRKIERAIDGPRNARIALASAPWSAKKVAKRIVKQIVFVALAFVIAHVFLSYFVSLPKVLEIVRQNPRDNWTAFLWAFAVTAVVYFNFTWFREQLCLIICPYGRLQSALIDKDSLIIGYDVGRGEPRGKSNDPNAGDCVDCRRCVVVCPTGIDIRNGLQMECIGCANCIDACDEVMIKLGRAQGLVRYDSRRGFDDGTRRFLRPRLAFYVAAGALGLTVALTMFSARQTFEANVVHIGVPFVVRESVLENQRMIHIVKKRDVASRFSVRPHADHDARITLTLPQSDVEIEALGSMHLPVILRLERHAFTPGMRARLLVSEVGGDVRELRIEMLGPTPPNAR